MKGGNEFGRHNYTAADLLLCEVACKQRTREGLPLRVPLSVVTPGSCVRVGKAGVTQAVRTRSRWREGSAVVIMALLLPAAAEKSECCVAPGDCVAGLLCM